MIANIVEMHAAVRGHLDQSKSPRVTRATINQFLNTANDFLYNGFCKTFQVNQQSRDGLRQLTVNDYPLTPVNNVFTYPADYMQETALQTLVDGVWRSSQPTTYIEKNELADNYFTEPDPLERTHIESAAGTTCYFGSGTMTAGKLSYIMKYPKMYWSDTAISQGANVLVVGTMYYVATSTITHNSVTYVVGQTFIAANTAMTGAGTVNAIQNSLLDDSTWENMCIEAAALISGSIEDYSRFQVKEIEAKK